MAQNSGAIIDSDLDSDTDSEVSAEGEGAEKASNGKSKEGGNLKRQKDTKKAKRTGDTSDMSRTARGDNSVASFLDLTTDQMKLNLEFKEKMISVIEKESEFRKQEATYASIKNKIDVCLSVSAASKRAGGAENDHMFRELAAKFAKNM